MEKPLRNHENHSTIHSHFTWNALCPVCFSRSLAVDQKAWSSLGKNNFDEVERLANEAVRRWGENARKRNNGLSKLPSTKEAKGYATLNEQPQLSFKGEALKEGRPRGAQAAYYTVLADFNYSQTGHQGLVLVAAAHVVTGSELSPRVSKSFLGTAPLPASSSFLVEDCFTLRKKGEKGVGDNIPRINATRSYWIIRGDRVV